MTPEATLAGGLAGLLVESSLLGGASLLLALSLRAASPEWRHRALLAGLSGLPLGAAAALAWRGGAPLIDSAWVQPALVIWAAGALLVLARFGAGLLHLSAAARAARPLGGAARAEPAARVLIGAGFPVPLTWGWRAPIVLLPPAASTWSPAERRSAIRHELAHVRRADWAAQTLSTVICALFWFHPLAWLAHRRLKLEAELSCDARVIASGIRPSVYASHLLARAAELGGARPPAAACPVAGGGLSLRVRAVLAPTPGRPGWQLTLPLILALPVLLAAARPLADPPPKCEPAGPLLYP